MHSPVSRIHFEFSQRNPYFLGVAGFLEGDGADSIFHTLDTEDKIIS